MTVAVVGYMFVEWEKEKGRQKDMVLRLSGCGSVARFSALQRPSSAGACHAGLEPLDAKPTLGHVGLIQLTLRAMHWNSCSQK